MARRALTARLARALRALDRFGVGRLRETAPAQLLLRGLMSISESEVIDVLDAVERAGVRVWVAGGWGIDALLGGRTRAHTDLDLVLDAADDAVAGALDALAGVGIGYVDEEAVGGPWMPVLVKVTDRAGRAVDLCPLDLHTLPVPEPFATGTLAGRTVRCLSPALQVAFHRGYRQRPSQRADLARLSRSFGLDTPPEPPGRLTSASRRLRAGAGRLVRRAFRRPPARQSALLVPVPAADEAIAARDLAGAEPGIPPHITVLFPFVPAGQVDAAVEHLAEEVAASFRAFDFRLDRLGRFPGILYLAPEPVRGFVDLTRTFARYWPEHPPYDGAYDEVIPHLTVVDGEEPPGLADALAERLPIRARADEVWLMVEEPSGAWTVRRRFPLAGI